MKKSFRTCIILDVQDFNYQLELVSGLKVNIFIFYYFNTEICIFCIGLLYIFYYFILVANTNS